MRVLLKNYPSIASQLSFATSFSLSLFLFHYQSHESISRRFKPKHLDWIKELEAKRRLMQTVILAVLPTLLEELLFQFSARQPPLTHSPVAEKNEWHSLLYSFVTLVQLRVCVVLLFVLSCRWASRQISLRYYYFVLGLSSTLLNILRI